MSKPDPIADAEHVAVSAHRDGFRRAGREWTVQPRTVAVADLTAAELDQLRRDPNIAVVPTTPGAAPAGASAGAADARAALVRVATRLAPEDAERTKSGRLGTGWLEAATGLDSVTAAERDAAHEAAAREAG